MIKSTEIQLLTKIKKARRGTLFFTADFLFTGNTKTVGKTLERLVKKGELTRVATGIYTRPRKSKLFGYVLPGAEEIAKAIARRDRARIVPTGAYAMHALGLSTQVPMNIVFLTDGAARKLQIGNQTIKFKKVTPKRLSGRGNISKLVIQALITIGKGSVTPQEEQKIMELLRQEKRGHLEHDIRLAPEWIRKIMREALK